MEKTVLITGGSGGLGVAVTKHFLQQEWQVVVPVFQPSEQQHLPQDQRLTTVEADLFHKESAVEVVKKANLQAAPLTAVVNLVGGFSFGGKIHETSIDVLDNQFRLNIHPTYHVTAAALPLLQENGGGSVVCISSRSARKPTTGSAAYTIAKAAVLAFVDAVAAEYCEDHIRANALLPSVIDTPANRAAMPSSNYQQWVRPERIAATICFLCSDAAQDISGAHIPVYGQV